MSYPHTSFMTMTLPTKLTVFIDAQNTYRSARESFFQSQGPSVNGQFDPMKLGKVIESRGGPNGAPCSLQEVRVYTGRPDSNKEPKTHAAHMKQCKKWETDGVTVVYRYLRYPWDWPKQKAQEKGIDVALAIDFVSMAVDGAYDVGVIMSTDTDLLPPLEFTRDRYSGVRHVAVASWSSPYRHIRLSIPGSNVWCHWLDQDDYDAVADPTNYNR